jgi:hypothetical protein
MSTAARKLMDGVTAQPLAIATSATYNSASTNQTTHNITLPSGIQSGDLLLMFLSVDGGTDNLTNTGWTRLLTEFTTDSECRYVLGRIATGSEGSTVSFTTTNSEHSAAVTYRITGARNDLTTNAIAVSGSVNTGGNATTVNPPSLTPSWGSATNLWFATAMISDGAITSVVSYPTDYNLGQNATFHSNSAGQGVLVAARILTASSEDPGAFTWTTARRASAYTIAVRPA